MPASLGTDEAGAIAAFIYQQLTSDSRITGNPTLVSTPRNSGDPPDYRIYENPTPQGAWSDTTKPSLIELIHSSSLDRLAHGNVRIFSWITYVVKVVYQGESYSPASEIYTVVDSILQGARGTVTINGQQYYVSGVQRRNQLQYPEDRDEISYRHLGGRYRFFVYPLTA